jgi:hypothetical protein
MKYIGNESKWITNEMMSLLKNNAGSKLPVWDPNRWHGHPLLDKVRLAGEEYFKGTIPNNFFHVFYSRTDCMENFNFTLPNLIPSQASIVWWFSKLNPGEYQFTHYDAILLGVAHDNPEFTNVGSAKKLINPKRYTMFLQDYEPGHAFIYEDKMSANYKKGDIFEWSNPETLHGVANVSFTPRYTLQLVMYDMAI